MHNKKGQAAASWTLSWKMESFLSVRSVGEESLQMWDLNKRLEVYLARVKFLEEENELLKAEIQGLKGGSVENSWKAKYEEELAALRATLDQAYQDKCMVELARDSLYEEVQQVTSRCQRERAAQEEAKMFLSLNKKEMEEEKRTHLWLREKVTQLEKEIEALVETHQEELAGLNREMASFSQSFESFRLAPACFQPVEVEDYAKRLSNIWKGAVETYKMEVSHLEASLCEAKENLWKATERNRQNQLQLQQLEKELVSLKVRKKNLEESISQQWAQQQGDVEKLQMAVESLEEEKCSLRAQISQVLEERQQLMHLKMSLSLEVATYRTLLEAESTRLQMPAREPQLASGPRDAARDASHSRLQGLPMDRGSLGSRDVRPSPITFPEGGLKSGGLKIQAKSLFVPLAPGVTKTRSSGAREFQKVKTVLQSQSTKALDGVLPPKEAFALMGSSLASRPSQMGGRATRTERGPQPLLHASSPPSQPFPLEVSEDSDGSPDSRRESAKAGAPTVEAEGRREKEEDAITGGAEKEEEEKLLSDKSESLDGPFPSQLVTDTLEVATQDGTQGEGLLESSSLSVVGRQVDVSSDRSSSLEEEEEEDLPCPLTTGELERATGMAQGDQMQYDQPTDLLEDNQACEDFAEVNGGQETQANLQGLEQDMDASLPLNVGLPGIERNAEDAASPVAGENESDEEAGSVEWKAGNTNEEPPALQKSNMKEAPKCPESATDASINVRSNPQGKGLVNNQQNDLGGALGVTAEEVNGGAVVLEEEESPEAPLSVGSWSLSREDDLCDVQEALLGSEHLQREEGLDREAESPTIHTALFVGDCQEPLFLQLEEETVDSQKGFDCKIDPALPEQESKEMGLDFETLCMEEALLRGKSSVGDGEGSLVDEPKVTERRDATEEYENAGGDALRPQSYPSEDLGDGGTIEKEGSLGTEVVEEPQEIGTVLPGPGSDVANLSGEESLPEEPRTDAAPEGPLLVGQKGDEGGLSEALPEAEDKDLIEGDTEVAEGGEDMGALEMEDFAGTFLMENGLQEKGGGPETSEDEELGAAPHQAGERETAPRKEGERPRSEQILHQEQGQQPDRFPWEAKEPAVEDQVDQPQTDDLGSEETLKHLETSLNSTDERDRTEKELESGEPNLVQEKLPDHSPSEGYTGQVPESQEMAEVPPLSQKSPRVLEDVLEEDSLSIQQGKESDVEQRGPKQEHTCRAEATPNQDSLCSEQPPAVGSSVETMTGTSPFTGDHHPQGTVEPERSREGEEEELGMASGKQPEEALQLGAKAEERSEVPQEGMGPELAWEPEEHPMFTANECHPSLIQEAEQAKKEESPELSGQDPTEGAGTKPSSLTSVADLGEIVLERERGSLVGPNGRENEDPPISDPELPVQQKTVSVEDPLGTGFPEPSPEDAVSLSVGGRKDSDILEIVEQALEFNQEVIKAAGDELGALCKDALQSPEEKAVHGPSASVDQGEAQASIEALLGNSPGSHSPVEMGHLLAESRTANGLQEGPDLEDVPGEFLNGIEQYKTGTSGEGFSEEVMITAQFCREGLGDLTMAETLSQGLLPPIPSREEGLRGREINLEVLEKVSLDQEDLEASDENLLDHLQQTGCVKGGKEPKLEVMPFPFGDEICCQPLELHPEGKEAL